ncbi:response regulator transcription factor [Paenibacillus contaminans]|uniref:Response regulatory domain-containing protein n=1 Tax=Paenibacillus contaminans TaxID=450362 RepID=A0A329MPY6_9BACL|nr:response regulator transcription factor [Paenibacillus contaminans]RAV21590.1 hypothetical protein DQG23_10040 [Paenibacillus contaminans]
MMIKRRWRCIDKIKVMLVEDDIEWQRGICDFLGGHPQIEIVCCVSSRKECQTALQNTAIDVVLMDIMLGEQSGTGLDAALDIAYEHLAVKVIMLSSVDYDDEVFYEAFLSGAYDFVYKNDFEQLPNVIAESLENKTSKYGSRLRKLVFDKKKELLTPHDSELLRLIGQGRTQQEISQMNSVSLAAVKKQVGRLLEKFNWSGSSKELADKCLKWGLLDKP